MSRRRTESKAPSVQQVRCAIYTRKSSEEGLELEYNSLDAQRDSAEAYIAAQKHEGWVCLPDRYDDGGFSGGNMERPALGRLLKDIEAGKVDCVVVYKVDRLSRSLMDFARIVETFDRHQVSFVSVTQQFNTTHSMGRLTLNILLSFAQFEREIIGERIRDKIAAQRRKGKWAGGIPVLGYDVDRSGPSPKLMINAQEAASVRGIFDLYQQLGSLLPVVQELERRGWCNKTWRTKGGQQRGGRVFDKCSLHTLLTNPIYIGRIKHKSEYYDGEHEAIVAREVFEKVQKRLSQNGRSGGAVARNRHGALLRGLLYCKACGHAMVHTFTSKGQRQYRYYTCVRAIKSGVRACPSGALPAGEIERMVVEQVRGIAGDRELLAEVLVQAKAEGDRELEGLQKERGELGRELGRHQNEIRKLATSGAADGVTTRRMAELHERVQRGEARMVELAGKIEQLQRDRVEQKDVEAAFADFDNVWGQLSPKEQARVLALLVARVEYDVKRGTVASTIGNTRRIRLKYDWCEPAILWAAIVAGSGQRKSPPLDAALSFLRKIQAEDLKRWQSEMVEYKLALQEWKASRNDEDPAEEPQRPLLRRWTVTDTTVEALALRLEENPRGLLLARDELSAWFSSFNQYKGGKGSDASQYLEMYRAGVVTVDRRGGDRPTIYIPRSSLSLVGTIQPRVLRRCLGQQHFDSGLAARFLLAMPPTRQRRWSDKSINPYTKEQVETIYRRLSAMEFGSEGEPVDVPLTEEAQAIFAEFVDVHGEEQMELEDEALEAAWSKLEG